jgi:hypothetical protein
MTTSTRTPTLTLLNLTRPVFIPTSTPILRLLRTPTLRATNMASLTLIAPTALPILPDVPTCYETPVGSLWCLGLIRNSLTVPITEIIIRVYLVRADGTALADGQTFTARKTLAPGEFSPYGVLFSSTPEGFAGPVATLISARQANATYQVVVHVLESQWRDGAFHVSGSLVNANIAPLHRLSVVATLFDSTERVTGFREMRWPDTQLLDSGAALPFEFDATPLAAGTSRVEVNANAEPN